MLFVYKSCNKPLVEAIISVLITLKAVNIFNHAASELFLLGRGVPLFSKIVDILYVNMSPPQSAIVILLIESRPTIC
jgi:hypothetical protein